MPEFVIRQIPVLRDNYVYLLHDTETGATGAVDPSIAEPVLRALGETGWRLTHILNTHHHPDHTGGNLEINQAIGATIVGPRADRARIPALHVVMGVIDGYPVCAYDA